MSSWNGCRAHNGQKLCGCHAEVAVDDSKLKLSVYYLGFAVYHKTLDQPEAIKKGDFVSTFSEDFPSYTPPVRSSLHIPRNPHDDAFWREKMHAEKDVSPCRYFEHRQESEPGAHSSSLAEHFLAR